MTCPVCPLKLTREVYHLLSKACPSCQRQLRQMMAGFNGVMVEHRAKRTLWDNSETYEEWKSKLAPEDAAKVSLKDDETENAQRCDIRDMKRVCGMPKFLDLEKQVFTAWILEGQKDERIQEVLGLTYSQVYQVKKVIKSRLKKQMAYYHQIKKLEKEGKADGNQ